MVFTNHQIVYCALLIVAVILTPVQQESYFELFINNKLSGTCERAMNVVLARYLETLEDILPNTHETRTELKE